MRRVLAIAVLMLAIVAGAARPSAAITISLGATQDAAVFDNHADGSEDWFFYTWSGATSARGLIQFDTSSLTGLYIQNATLSLYHEFNAVDGAVMHFYRNTSAWDQDLVDYSTLPSTAPGSVSSLTMTGNTSFVYRTFDLTSVVQGWANGSYANNGLTLIQTPDGQPDEDGEEFWAYFASSDNLDPALRPLLTVVAEPVPEPATLMLLGTGVVGIIRARRRRR